ncbi:MAG: hypothetical protein U9Q66_03335 [Patescibacteria group bacterium]|nr:hypothetical protein [Patescibacteria group bacterium]
MILSFLFTGFHIGQSISQSSSYQVILSMLSSSELSKPYKYFCNSSGVFGTYHENTQSLFSIVSLLPPIEDKPRDKPNL